MLRPPDSRSHRGHDRDKPPALGAGNRGGKSDHNRVANRGNASAVVSIQLGCAHSDAAEATPNHAFDPNDDAPFLCLEHYSLLDNLSSHYLTSCFFNARPIVRSCSTVRILAIS